MSHDKIRAAARKRMAETGEPYATARREAIKNYQGAGAASSSSARWFSIDYSDMGRISLWDETRRGGGPGRGGVEVDSAVLRVRMPDFHLDIPRGSVRSAARSDHQTRGTIGVHGRRGRCLVNGSHDGLVELVIDPPCYLPRQLSTVFRKMKVSSLIISLVDPDGFIAAVGGDRGLRPTMPQARRSPEPGPRPAVEAPVRGTTTSPLPHRREEPGSAAGRERLRGSGL